MSRILTKRRNASPFLPHSFGFCWRPEPWPKVQSISCSGALLLPCSSLFRKICKHAAPHLNAHLEQVPLCRLCNICKGRTLHLDLPVRVTQCTEQMQVICQHSASVSDLINKSPGSAGSHGARRLRCLTCALINYRLGNERGFETKRLRLNLVEDHFFTPAIDLEINS